MRNFLEFFGVFGFFGLFPLLLTSLNLCFW